VRRAPIPLDVHAAIEPFVAVVLIAAPWLFGFSDVTSATVISIVVGAAMLMAGAATQWRYSLVKLIPLRVHFLADLALGAVLILSPFVFGFLDEGGAARFTLIAGVLELLTALGTRWEPETAPRHTRGRGRSGAAATR
jgi:SPW repeat